MLARCRWEEILSRSQSGLRTSQTDSALLYDLPLTRRRLWSCSTITGSRCWPTVTLERQPTMMVMIWPDRKLHHMKAERTR